MSRSFRVQIGFVVLIALVVLILMRNASGSEFGARSTSEGHLLAEAWCKPCHAIEPHVAGISNQAPSFEAIANRHGTTALSLNVFLNTDAAEFGNCAR